MTGGARLLIVAGKGGVGKTTVAAATAVATARAGRRVLVVSLDRAHNLGDVFTAPLGPEPARIPLDGAGGLRAMEIDPQVELVRNWSVLQGYLGRFFTYLGLGGAVAEEMAVLPGLEELLVLDRLATLAAAGQAGSYDLIVADFAPTATALRLLSLPDLLSGPLAKWVDWDQRFAHLMRPLQDRLFKVPIPEDDVYDEIRRLADRLAGLQALLADPARCAVRLVMVPETMVLAEARRTFTYLSLFGLTVEGVIANRVLPPEAVGGYLGAWTHVQDRVLREARESFADAAFLTLRYQPDEVLGVDSLAAVAAELYGESDPVPAFRDEPPLRFTQDEGRSLLTISLYLTPAEGRGLDLRRRDSELILTVGGWRRVVELPGFLAGRPVEKARLSGGRLEVIFGASGG